MPLINYESPDYQRMYQRTMQSPLMQTNPAMHRKLMSQYAKQVTQQRVALESAVQSREQTKHKIDYNNKMMGLAEREMGIKEVGADIRSRAQTEQARGNQISETYNFGKLSLGEKEMKDKEEDLDMQTLMGLVPLGYSIYEGNRRAKQTDDLTAAQMDFYTNTNNRTNPPASANPTAQVNQLPAGSHVQPGTGTSFKKKQWWSSDQNIAR